LKEALLKGVSYLALFFLLPALLVMLLFIQMVRKKNPVKADNLKDWFMKPSVMILVNGSISLLIWAGLVSLFYFGYLF